MTHRLGDWQDLEKCEHVVIASSRGYDDTLKNQFLRLTGMETLPDFPDQIGKTFSFFSKNAKTQYHILRINEAQKSQKNIELLRVLIQKIPQNKSLGFYFEDQDPKIITDLTVAIFLSFYEIGRFKKENLKISSRHIIAGPNFEEHLIQKAKNIAKSMAFAMELVDLPSNMKTPDYAAEWVKKESESRGLGIEIIKRDELLKLGFGAICSVGQASKYGSYLVKITYKGNPTSDDIALVLVGKGVTFDTGGISLKDSTNMHYMKSDLGGAAAAIGTIFLAKDQGLKTNICTLVPFVENAIDANSMRPGDVIKAYDGHTIEVIDTDAEGRLILADALSYSVKEFQKATIIDLATLTGNVVSALGYAAAGIFSSNQEIVNQLTSSGYETGERCWQLPIWDEYSDMIQSDIADVKNYHGKPFGGAIAAAKFLEFFTNKHPRWVHLDIAGVAFGDSGLVKSKIATAYGIRLLNAFIEKYIV